MYIGELFKFYKHRLFTIITGILLLVFVLMFYGRYFAISIVEKVPYSEARDLTLPYLFFTSVEISSWFVIILSYIIICSVLGNEFSWNTFKTIAMRGTNKIDFLNSKILAALTYAVIYFIIGTIILSLLSLVYHERIMSNALEDTDPSKINVFFVFVRFAIFILSALPYIGMGVFFTVLTKSPGGGFGIGLIYILVVENLIAGLCSTFSSKLGDWLLYMPDYFLGSQIIAINSKNLFEINSEKEYLLLIYQPVLISIVYAIVFYLMSVFIIKKRDILN